MHESKNRERNKLEKNPKPNDHKHLSSKERYSAVLAFILT
jgi:hypothetical protein